MVEAALILPAVLLGLMAMLDLGLAVARSNSLSDCARRGARLAIVHGSDSDVPWGPVSWSGTALEAHPLTDDIRPRLLCMPPGEVTVRVTWLDGDREPGDRVQVELKYSHSALIGMWLGPIRLSARSVMRLVH